MTFSHFFTSILASLSITASALFAHPIQPQEAVRPPVMGAIVAASFPTATTNGNTQPIAKAQATSFAPKISPSTLSATTRATTNYVTHDELSAQLNQVSSSLRQLIFANTAPAAVFTSPQIAAGGDGALAGSLALPINNLTNITVRGVSGLTASDIPALNYFPASSTIAIEYGGTRTSTRASANKLLLADALGNWEYVSTSSLGISGGATLTGTQGQLAYFSGTNTAIGTSSLFISSSGNVGIGTTSPAAPFELFGTNSSTNLVTGGGIFEAITNADQTNGNFDSLSYREVNSSGLEITGTRISGVFNNHTTGAESADLAFLTRNNGILSEKLRILGNGNVGIGTSSPATTLSLAGTFSATDNGSSSVAQLGSELTADGNFSTDPTGIWTMGSGWSWDSANKRAAYTGSGGPIGVLYVTNGGSGYTNGDTITIAGGTADATYTANVQAGKVLSLTRVSAGTTYTTGTAATTGGTGTGLSVLINRISEGAPISEALPSSSGTSLVSFTIQNRTAGGIKFTGFNTAYSSNSTSGSEYYLANGTYQLVVAASTTVSFTPTADFAGAITNVSVKPITSPAALATISNTDGSASLELRPGGIGLLNTFVGLGSGLSNTTGNNGAAFGYHALAANTTGFNNTAIGGETLDDNVTGSENTALGFQALQFNTTGGRNTATGIYALVYNQTGSLNTASGYDAIGNNISGGNNSGFGYNALNGVVTGSNNTGVGYETLFDAVSGGSNTAVGAQALLDLTTGSGNIAIGSGAGKSALTTGSNDILIGINVDVASSTINQFLNIGDVLYGSGMYNGGSISATPTTAGKIAVGTTTPYSRLTVWGPDTSAGTQAFSVVNNASSTALMVTDAGTVGIGTLTPGAPLDVAGNVLLDGSGNFINFNFGSGSGGYGLWDNSGTLEFKNSNGAWSPLGSGTSTLSTPVNYVQSLDLNNAVVTDTNSAAATTLYTYPVQANTLNGNKILRVEISGMYTDNSGSSRTITLTMTYGGTTVVSKASAALSTSATSGTWHATFYLAASSTNAQLGNFIADASNGATSVTWGGGGFSAVNSAQAQNLVIQATNSAAATTITITKESAETELLNASGNFGSQWTSNGASISYATTSETVGIGTTTPYAPLEVWGSDTASSTLAFNVVNNASTTVFAVFDGGNAQLSGTLTQSSDQRLKTNIQSLDASSSLSLIDQLNPVTFNWRDPGEGTTPQLGFIAQQVQQVFPTLVSTTSATALTPGGTLGLNYIGLVAPIVKAIQALVGEISNLEQTVAGFAQSLTSRRGTFTDQLCVGTTCVTPAQFQSMVAAANQSPSGGSSPSSQSGDASTTPNTPPVIQINGGNPAHINIGDNYQDLGATITGPQQDLNLGIKTFLNGQLVSNIVIDTSATATETIDYVATDQSGLTATSTRTIVIEASPSTVPDNNATTTTLQ